MSETGLVMDVKHFAVHDGDGIRTTVFLKGCPLRCVWCHNPEGLVGAPSYSYIAKKCIGCGECEAVCGNGVHSFVNGKHVIDRTKCVFCGECEKACLGDAIRIYGRRMTVGELMPELLKDREFYESSGGGVTLSGGECLLQADFCEELLHELKKENINTAVDTCGAVPRSSIDKVLPYTDTFLYDIKAFSPETHKKATGMRNEIIFDNLRYIDSMGKAIEVRIPFVPEYNMQEIPQIAELLSAIANLTKVRVLPYHNLAGSKYGAIGFTARMPKELPTTEQIDEAMDILRSRGITVAD